VHEVIPCIPLKTPSLSTELRGEETILVVEDNDSLRSVVANALKKYGYRIMEADCGDQALSICERHREQIDLMLTDVVMPHMSGKELAGRLAPLHPKMRVLYMSGYTDDIIADQGLMDSAFWFLPKPFKVLNLIKKVREIFDTSSSS
jgi:DNA-binding NtrC family response regulator